MLCTLSIHLITISILTEDSHGIQSTLCSAMRECIDKLAPPPPLYYAVAVQQTTVTLPIRAILDKKKYSTGIENKLKHCTCMRMHNIMCAHYYNSILGLLTSIT